MYVARGNQIFYSWGGKEELFLTVHPTKATVLPDEQAKILVRVLNEYIDW